MPDNLKNGVLDNLRRHDDNDTALKIGGMQEVKKTILKTKMWEVTRIMKIIIIIIFFFLLTNFVTFQIIGAFGIF